MNTETHSPTHIPQHRDTRAHTHTRKQRYTRAHEHRDTRITPDFEHSAGMKVILYVLDAIVRMCVCDLSSFVRDIVTYFQFLLELENTPPLHSLTPPPPSWTHIHTMYHLPFFLLIFLVAFISESQAIFAWFRATGCFS